VTQITEVIKMMKKVCLVLIILCLGVDFKKERQSFFNVEEPKLLKAYASVYPALAKTARVSQRVIIEATISGEGKVISTKIIQGHPLLNKAAEESAKTWVYSKLENNPKNRIANIIFSYALMPENSKDNEVLASFIFPNEFDIKDRMPTLIQSPNIDPAFSKTKTVYKTK
jgi:hypothetical protein